MKKIMLIIAVFILVFTLTACSGGAITSLDIESISQSEISLEQGITNEEDTQQVIDNSSEPISVEYEEDDLASGISSSDVTYIKLEGDSITTEGSGVTVNGSLATITSAGTYNLSGTLNNGQILVDTADEETVVLIMDGADIRYASGAPIYIASAEKTVITLGDGTQNTVTDGEAYTLEDPETGEPNAAIFSKADLSINGNGSLTVNAVYHNGITSKDDLKITSGNITVNAVNDAIRGRDSIVIMQGNLTLNAGGDGMQSNNDEDPEKGYIFIEGGTLSITAGLDGIQAETRLMVSGGNFTINSGGGNFASFDFADSAKGLKAGVDLTITNGAFTIDSADDALHSNGSMTIDAGDITISSGDDGMHADASLVINGGNITILKSYEGIESAVITINDGNMQILSNDDGINAAGGMDGSSINGRPGQNTFAMTGDYSLDINGGYIYVDALGDGMDINGPIEMTAGTVIINGPAENFNGALDYSGYFTITGGYLVAAGSSSMAMAPSDTSTQYSIIYNYQSPQAAGTLVHIESENGEDILTFAPAKEYQSLVLSSAALKNGATYTVYSGGSSTGNNVDGLYMDGTYSPGNQATSLTISGMVTGSGGFGGGFPGGRGGGRGPRP